MSASTEKIELLSGDVDGVNLVFVAPIPFAAGSFRLVLNGLFYDADDSTFGWTEVNTTTVTLTTAPVAGDVVQGFFTALSSTGSPVDPEGSLP